MKDACSWSHGDVPNETKEKTLTVGAKLRFVHVSPSHKRGEVEMVTADGPRAVDVLVGEYD
jgi:hypothetical protein